VHGDRRGNTFIRKPSEETSLLALAVAHSVRRGQGFRDRARGWPVVYRRDERKTKSVTIQRGHRHYPF
jgi:hypothetical protein